MILKYVVGIRRFIHKNKVPQRTGAEHFIENLKELVIVFAMCAIYFLCTGSIVYMAYVVASLAQVL